MTGGRRQTLGRRRRERPSARTRQEVRRWHRRSRRTMGMRVLRAVTRGCQLGSVAAILGYVAIDFVGFLYTPTPFTVPHISVTGNTRVTSGEILRAARLAPAMHVFAWPLEDIQGRAEQHPRVRTARVTRTFPDTLHVHVQEREPLALLLGDPLLEVDAEGVVLGPYEPGRSPVGPVLTGHDLERVTPGMRIGTPAVREALAVIASYQASPSHDRVPIAEVALGEPGGPMLWLNPGVQVACTAGMEPIQWARLGAVLDDLHARGTGLHRVRAIDLRFAHIVPVRMRTMATS